MGLRQHMRQAVNFAPLQTDIPHQKLPYSGVCRDILGGGFLDKHHCRDVLLVLTTGIQLG